VPSGILYWFLAGFVLLGSPAIYMASLSWGSRNPPPIVVSRSAGGWRRSLPFWGEDAIFSVFLKSVSENADGPNSLPSRQTLPGLAKSTRRSAV
jgi:hypothetical protein